MLSFIRSALIILPLILSNYVQANIDEIRENTQVRDMLLDVTEQKVLGLKSLNTGLLGDRFDITTGDISFYRQIASIPGNSNLPVSLGQILKGRNGWEFDSPSISTKVFGRFGLSASEVNNHNGFIDPRIEHGELWGVDRCSGTPQYTPIYVKAKANGVTWSPGATNTDASFYPLFGFPYMMIEPKTHSGPLTMQTPGGQNQAVLFSNKTNELLQDPNSTAAMYTTSNNWHISCIPEIGNNQGEGFKVITNNGHIYTFDKLFYQDIELSLQEKKLSDYDETYTGQYSGDSVGWRSIDDYEYKMAHMKASKIEDVYGNWVKYDYDSEGTVERIYSSDNREITVSEAINDKRTITVNDRIWESDKKSLKLPDNTIWSQSADQDSAASPNADILHTDIANEWFCKEETWTATITHPNGTIGHFTFKPIRQLYSGVKVTLGTWLKNCNVEYHSANRMRKQGTLSYKLVRKSLQLPSGASYHWLYDYQTERSETVPDDGYITGTEITTGKLKWHKVTNPDGTIIRYWINRAKYSSSYGNVEKKEIFQNITDFNNNNPLSTTNNIYQPSDYIGAAWLVQGTAVYRPYLKTKTMIMHNHIDDTSDTYNTEYEYNKDIFSSDFSYGQPTKITRFSDVNDDSALYGTWTNGKGKIVEEINYKHIKKQWILNLPEKIIVNGKEYDNWIYDDNGRLKEYKRFGSIWGKYHYHLSGTDENLLKTFENSKGQTTEYSNYKQGKAKTIKRPDEQFVYAEYDDNGWLTSQQNALGNITTYDYDDVGWLESINKPAPAAPISVTYIKNKFGVLETITGLPTGNKVTTYDNFLRPILIQNNSVFKSIQYDHNNRPTFQSNPSFDQDETAGVSTTYDALGRTLQIKETVYPNTKTDFTFESGNTVKSTLSSDENTDTFITLTKKSGFGNSNDGYLTSVYSPENVTTHMSYDQFSLRRAITQSGMHNNELLSKTQSFTYNSRDKLCRQYIPETGVKLFDYDELDRINFYQEGQSDTNCIELAIDRPDQSIKMTYTKMGQLDKTIFPSAKSGYSQTPNIDRDYDYNGN